MAQAREVFLFQPNQVSGCQLWLDGVDPNGNGTSVANGASISTWVDKSGQGNTASASVAPTYDAISRYVLFNGSTQFFTLPNGTYPFGNTPYSIFIVAYTRNSSNPQWVLAGGNEITNQAIGLLFYTTNAVWHSWWVNEYRVDNSIVNNVPSIVNISYSSTRSIIVNGGTASVNSPGATRANPNTSNFIGRRAGDASQFFNGGMAECIVFNSEIPTSQRQQIEGYLAWKWGLQANLPSTHPFRNYRPLAVQPIPPQVPNMPLVTQGTQPFIPTQVSGCQLWLDGVDPNGNGTVPANGASVSIWRDKSTSANHASIVSGYTSPTYVTNSLNGRPGVFFSNSVLSTQTPIQLGSFFGVCLTQQNGTLLSGAGSTANNPWSPYYCIIRQENPVGNALFLLSFTTGTPSYPNYITTSLNTNYIFAGTYDGVSQMYNTINGSDPVSNSFVGGTPKTATATYIGGDWWDGSLVPSLFTLGPIYEIISYSGFVNTAQRQQVEGYLAWKWGLQANLPVNHPYKNRAIAPFPYTTVPVPMSLNIWLPIRISGCQLWLDGADPNGNGILPSTGANVSTWVDKSGSGNNGSTGGSSVPTYSNRAVVFNGSGYYNTNYSSVLASESFFMVYQWSTITADAGLISGTQVNQRVFYVSPSISRWLYLGGIAAWGRHSTEVMTSNVTYLASFTWNAASLSVLIYRNGSSLSLTNTNSPSPFSGTPVTSVIGNGMNGSVNEVIGFNATLTTFQRQQVEGYLAWKWNFVASLPANHPYKRWPPSP